MIPASELALSPEGLPYHTHLGPDQLADNVLLVGDPGRIDLFRSLFDTIEYESRNREMHALTGTCYGCRFTALSTGMGCDNIDIVLTELDAAANIDLVTGLPKSEHRRLRMVRLGTCGSLHADLECDTAVASAYAIGLDGLLNYYQYPEDTMAIHLEEAFCNVVACGQRMARPYAVQASTTLLKQIAYDMPQGITVTAPGFYAPQGRHIRFAPTLQHLNEQIEAFSWNGLRVNNLEMETSGIYGMARMMGHQALTVCLVIANRKTQQFINQYDDHILSLADTILQRLAATH